MSASLGEVLLATGNLDICCGVDALLRQRFASNLDAMPPEGKVVFWCLSADGIVCNGGFQYLLERWSSPESYTLALEGFRAIGADECASALAEVLSLFPKGVPPADRDRRLRRWRRYEWRWDHPTVRQFWKGCERVPSLLVAYIRANRDAFERMLAPTELPPVSGADAPSGGTDDDPAGRRE